MVKVNNNEKIRPADLETEMKAWSNSLALPSFSEIGGFKCSGLSMGWEGKWERSFCENKSFHGASALFCH